ncbi:protein FAR1-RELATED SEQUENCE 5-like [Camellia sinensis]|uniref:protein FAR1-RELATED SEQUENCE 5-like n=1 Tax=Camellia sinensis TaxID=4442 RepID=UPI001036E7E8|nr:protein FAR1-RELATED SEQUENCE 5-like [Camellia sinensis]
MEEQRDGESGGDAMRCDAMAKRPHCGDSEVMEENNIVDDCGWKSKVGMPFDSEQAAYDFYNMYGGKVGFSIRKAYANKNRQTKEITSRTFVCYKEGSRGIDKRDLLVKNPRQEIRCGCGARFSIKLDRISGKYIACDFVEHHNHDLVPQDCIHILPSQRKISTTQAIEVELASQSGIPLRSAYELFSRESGGKASLDFTKLDQKNYLRSKRQKDLEYGEAVQLDCEEQISNIFWADAQMIMDYAQFGDVVTFDITYKLNNEHRPFGSFVGFNHHRETIIFGATLMYDETTESFTWLFQIFLEAMLNKAPKTIFTDQDAAMSKAILIVMPDTNHRLCTWHLMQNVVKHVSFVFDDVGVKAVFSKFMHDIDDEEEFRIQWDQMLDKYDACDNHWLEQTFHVKKKWG